LDADDHLQYLTEERLGKTFSVDLEYACSKGDVLALGDGTLRDIYSFTTQDSFVNVGTSASQKARQRTDAGQITVICNRVSVYVKKVGTPSDDLVIKIWDSAFTKVLAQTTIPASEIGTTLSWIEKPLSDIIDYQDVIIELSRSGSLDDTNYYQWGYYGATNYSSWYLEYWSGSAWTLIGNKRANFYLRLLYQSSKAHRASAVFSWETPRVLGLANADGVDGGSVNVVSTLKFTKTGWGLTPKTFYYLSNNLGKISTSPGLNTKVIGYAITSEDLILYL
jgi:hypothetical protein